MAFLLALQGCSFKQSSLLGVVQGRLLLVLNNKSTDIRWEDVVVPQANG
jgi:hypothetical protein